MKQLPLNIRLSDDYSFESYYTGGREQIVTRLTNLVSGTHWAGIYLSGTSGSGRTHLLQASCHAVMRRGQTAFYLPLMRLNAFNPSILDGLEGQALVVLDDIDACAGRTDWEEALFSVYNRLFDKGTPFIVAASGSPQTLGLSLADLTSRLSAMEVYRLPALSELDKRTIWQYRAKMRGLDVSEDVINYVFNHYSRQMSALCELLVQLDRESLSASRRLTVPFVRDIVLQLKGGRL